MTPDSSNELFVLSSSPHVRYKNTTTSVMMHVLIALAPAFIWGIITGGIMAVVLTVISVACCILFELGYQKLLKKPVTVKDLSAAVTGVLIAFNIPATCSPFVLIFGCFFAIIVVKQLFGGIGKNIVNPAIAARIFMFVSWPEEMTQFVNKLDTVSSATPLTSLSAGQLPKYTILDSFLGNIPGCIGEVSAILLLAGGLHLIVKRIITPHIPLAFIGTVAVLTFFIPIADLNPLQSMGYQLFSGGLMIGAIFMATDYTTSPVTSWGRIIYGVGCGALTVMIRYLGAYPEGVSFAIMIMNLLVWYIDKVTMPRVFGTRKPKAKKEEVGK
jgi:electron transport complex protein RnfD